MNAPPSQYDPKRRGMPSWLVILLCVVGAGVLVLPVLAVLSVYGVRKYIVNAQTAEARLTVGTLARDAVPTPAASNALCASASQPVPASLLAVKGSKYQSAESDWTIDQAS